MEIKGKLIVIENAKEVGSQGNQIRNCVVQTDEQYPQKIQIQFSGDKINLLNNRQINQEVVISVNLTGRDWVNAQGETVYFNTIKGWKIT